MPRPFKLAVWIPIVLLIIGMVAGAGAWAVAEHDGIEARAEARVLRADDRHTDAINRLEGKIDFLIKRLIP